MALKPEAFQGCFRDWIAQAVRSDDNGSRRLIAIDGKTCRGSHDGAYGLGPLHIVSAWASEEGIALGQIATEEGSNEITAIPLLLEQIDLTDCVITIDAMGCQKEIARGIVAGGGDFVIGVKDNQPTLREAIEAYFNPSRPRSSIVTSVSSTTSWRTATILASRPSTPSMTRSGRRM